MQALLLFFRKLFVIMSLLALTSCGTSIMNAAFHNSTVEANAIPPDFGQEETTLLCVIAKKKDRNSYRMIRHVKNEYNGSYQFIHFDTFASIKDMDINTYRYVLTYEVESVYPEIVNPDLCPDEDIIPQKSYFYTFLIVDRLTGRQYKCPLTSDFFSKHLQGYLKSLEAHRIQFSSKN